MKVLRHKDSRRDLWDLRKKGSFGLYQNSQSWDVFGNARYIISFIAERNKYAKFVGVWKIISTHKKKTKGFRYKTKELPGFEELEDILIVQWGEGTRSWAQWYIDKAIKMWKSYVKSHSGCNVLLKELLEKNPSRYKQFQFSVLRVLITVKSVLLHLEFLMGG